MVEVKDNTTPLFYDVQKSDCLILSTRLKTPNR